jgi:hypothetical protein
MGPVNSHRESCLSERGFELPTPPKVHSHPRKTAELLGFSGLISRRRDCPHGPCWRSKQSGANPSPATLISLKPGKIQGSRLLLASTSMTLLARTLGIQPAIGRRDPNRAAGIGADRGVAQTGPRPRPPSRRSSRLTFVPGSTRGPATRTAARRRQGRPKERRSTRGRGLRSARGRRASPQPARATRHDSPRRARRCWRRRSPDRA